ncbi:MAG: hypothetical protein JWL85_292 [Candidatus Saccharibacteria bacterium]|nr:hypothetical protein [Candidatus Saccharibacteria bacterium]
MDTPRPDQNEVRERHFSEGDLLTACEKFANRVGGEGHRKGLTDKVKLAWTIGERNEGPETTIRFEAQRYRKMLGTDQDEDAELPEVFTVYKIEAEVDHILEQLPPRVHQKVLDDGGEDVLNDPNIVFKAKHGVGYFINEAYGYLERNEYVTYSLAYHDDEEGVPIVTITDDFEHEGQWEAARQMVEASDDFDDGDTVVIDVSKLRPARVDAEYLPDDIDRLLNDIFFHDFLVGHEEYEHDEVTKEERVQHAHGMLAVLKRGISEGK